ncbi:MAG: MATE family efflux transporter [Pseudomonadota bacterium]|nr:MATE family efflux transporter [Pseudomonadota bacterium]
MEASRRLLARLSRVERQRLNRILVIGIPIIGSMLSQSITNLIDAAMVGQLSDVALAGVGIGSYANFLCVSVMMGLSAAVQAIVARHYGAKRHHRTTEPLFAGLFLTLLIGIPSTLLFIAFAEQYIGLYTDDAAVVAVASQYFSWRTAALTFVGMTFVFRGFWSGIGESGVYLRIALIMHVSNVIISYFLIFGFTAFGTTYWDGFGAVGSGMGSAASLLLAATLFYWRTFALDTRFRQLYHLSRKTIRQLVRLAIPNSVSQTLFALGLSVLFWIIGLIGTQEQAIGHILTQLSLLLIMPAVGLGIAGASLVGHALGAEEKDNAQRWGWDVVRVSIVIMAFLGLPMWVCPELVLTLFTNDSELIAIGLWPLRILGFAIAFEVGAIILTQTLLGAGASRQVMKINLIMQWIVFLPLAWLIGPTLGLGLTGVWVLQAVQRVSLTVIYALIWRRQHWAHIHL